MMSTFEHKDVDISLVWIKIRPLRFFLEYPLGYLLARGNHTHLLSGYDCPYLVDTLRGTTNLGHKGLIFIHTKDMYICVQCTRW